MMQYARSLALLTGQRTLVVSEATTQLTQDSQVWQSALTLTSTKHHRVKEVPSLLRSSATASQPLIENITNISTLLCSCSETTEVSIPNIVLLTL